MTHLVQETNVLRVLVDHFSDIWIGKEPYDDDAKQWLRKSGHYLNNPPPGCLFCIVVRQGIPDLFGTLMPNSERLGMCLIGRPVARNLPQDGSMGEITRMVLSPKLPYGLASHVLLVTADHARARGMTCLIAYHDRSIHTGCIYRKAGFRKDGIVKPSVVGWGSRSNRLSARYAMTSKRRWRLRLDDAKRAAR